MMIKMKKMKETFKKTTNFDNVVKFSLRSKTSFENFSLKFEKEEKNSREN